jgi:hypothetical protein
MHCHNSAGGISVNKWLSVHAGIWKQELNSDGFPISKTDADIAEKQFFFCFKQYYVLFAFF